MHYVLSDLLFFEGAVFLIFGAFLAGVNLYKMVVPGYFAADYAKTFVRARLGFYP